MNEAGTEFLLPDGWQTMQFFVESDKVPSRPATPMDQDSATFHSFHNHLFYTRVLLKSEGKIVEDIGMKYPCAPFYTTMLPHRYFFLSTCHGSHECLENGDEVNVYNSVHHSFKMKVVFYSKERDYILFESLVKLCEILPTVSPIIAGRHYIMLGYAGLKQAKKVDEHIEPCFASGIIMSSQPNESGHICGSSEGVSGLSGGPVFDLVTHQLIGICVSTDDLDDRQTTFGRFSSDMINYCKEITIVRILPVQYIVVEYHSSKESRKRHLSKTDQE